MRHIPVRGAAVEDDWNHHRKKEGGRGAPSLSGFFLDAAVEGGQVPKHAQRHETTRLALMLNQHIDEAITFAPERDFPNDVGLIFGLNLGILKTPLVR